MTLEEFIAEVQEVYEDADVDIRGLEMSGVRVEQLRKVRDRLSTALEGAADQPWFQ